MDASATFAPRILSGIDVVDQSWGGLFKGGRYLAYGRSASGRNILSTLFLVSGVETLETSLLVTKLRHADLIIQSAAIGFDVDGAVESGILRVSRTPFELELVDQDDDSLESSLKALASLIIDAKADRVVIDDFSSFTRFHSFDRFRTSFSRLITEVEHVQSTIMFGMPEPANAASKRIVEFAGSQMTGSMHVHTSCPDGVFRRTISLIPQIGHATRRTEVTWDLERLVAAVEAGLSRPAPRPVVRIDASKPPSDSEPRREPEERTVEVEKEPIPWAFRDSTPPPADELPSAEPAYFPSEPEVPLAIEPKLTVIEESQGQIFEDRIAFTEELQLYFDDFDSSETPFALVALRIDGNRDEQASDDFQMIVELVGEALHKEDSLFADSVSERIIVIMGDGNTEEAQQLFSHLKDRLRSEVEDRTDYLLNAVSAVVVPNGRPFSTAEAFVGYVLEDQPR